MNMDAAMDEIKRQMWNRWFNEEVPVLGDITPIEAAKTAQGRKKLDELLAFYDSMRREELDANIPTKYARWKLGYGPGSESEFAKEEAILNGNNSSTNNNKRTTQRKARHTQKLETKKVAIWIPRRCEVQGCPKRGNDVLQCSKCGCAFYCGKEHQVQDWSRHLLDCKTLRNTFDFLQPKPYIPEDELRKFPLMCFPISSSSSSSSSPCSLSAKSEKLKCFVCHSASSEVDITYTECCNLPICDNHHEYQIMSYSRDFCIRSHAMYTACDTHFEEEHEGDWRECHDCNKLYNGARPFSSTNGFCVTPCLEKFIPQGSMITFPCGNNPGCKNRILPGHSAYSSLPNGRVVCESCS